jgi:hypothetical protein
VGSHRSVVLTSFCVAGHEGTRGTASNRIWDKVHGDERQGLNPCRRSVLYTSQRYQDQNGKEIGKLPFFWHFGWFAGAMNPKSEKLDQFNRAYEATSRIAVCILSRRLEIW